MGCSAVLDCTQVWPHAVCPELPVLVLSPLSASRGGMHGLAGGSSPCFFPGLVCGWLSGLIQSLPRLRVPRVAPRGLVWFLSWARLQGWPWGILNSEYEQNNIIPNKKSPMDINLATDSPKMPALLVCAHDSWPGFVLAPPQTHLSGPCLGHPCA